MVRVVLVLMVVNRFAAAWSGAPLDQRSISTCDVDVPVPSQPSMSTPATASFRTQLGNIRLVPSVFQRRFEK